MTQVIIPRSPCGDPRPAVVRLDVIADSRTYIGTYYVEVPIECDRCMHNLIEIRAELASPCGTVETAVVVADKTARQAERVAIVRSLSEFGHHDAATLVAKDVQPPPLPRVKP